MYVLVHVGINGLSVIILDLGAYQIHIVRVSGTLKYAFNNAFYLTYN